jgi:hypothetical protein
MALFPCKRTIRRFVITKQEKMFQLHKKQHNDNTAARFSSLKWWGDSWDGGVCAPLGLVLIEGSVKNFITSHRLAGSLLSST